MKKHVYTLMATVALFSASPVIAMDIEGDELSSSTLAKRTPIAVPEYLTANILKDIRRFGSLLTDKGEYRLVQGLMKKKKSTIVSLEEVPSLAEINKNDWFVRDRPFFIKRECFGLPDAGLLVYSKDDENVMFLKRSNPSYDAISVPKELSVEMVKALKWGASLVTTQGEFILEEDDGHEIDSMLHSFAMVRDNKNLLGSWATQITDRTLSYEYTYTKPSTVTKKPKTDTTNLNFRKISPDEEKACVPFGELSDVSVLRKIIRRGSLHTTEGEYIPVPSYIDDKVGSPADALELTYDSMVMVFRPELELLPDLKDLNGNAVLKCTLSGNDVSYGRSGRDTEESLFGITHDLGVIYFIKK